MKDETYVFISDVKEKGSVARSARNARSHCGKGGRVRLPSDNLSNLIMTNKRRPCPPGEGCTVKIPRKVYRRRTKHA